MATKKKSTSKGRTTRKTSAKKSSTKKPKYLCYDCGTEVVVDCCGVGFRRLICCGEPMKKK
jgi:hypothetical protein